VVDAGRKVVGTISLPHLGGIFIPRVSKPKLMRQVHGTLANIARALKATVIHAVDDCRQEELYVRLGTMDIRSFWKISEREGIPAAQSLIIVGDRRDIQLRAIELGLRGIIVTSSLPSTRRSSRRPRPRGVSVISSPYDSATTAWVVRTASSIERVIDRGFGSVSRTPASATSAARSPRWRPPRSWSWTRTAPWPGVLSKSDILKPVQTRLSLSTTTRSPGGQRRRGGADHRDHRPPPPGAMNTPAPILFINEPVGSTCTIVADLFRSSGLVPTPEIAGIMMSGLISDTLHLNSPTTTPKDADILAWLAGSPARSPARSPRRSSPRARSSRPHSPEEIVQADHKVYDEEGVRFAVSQVEELGFANFWGRRRRSPRPWATCESASASRSRRSS
jgi:manganese-dependent inorganic pyrophosphatase